MSRATLPGPVSPTLPTATPPSPASPPARAGRANLRHAYDLALAGGLGGLFGLYLYVELVQAQSVYVRDAFAGLLIGGSMGVFLNAYSPFRDGAWLKLARAVAWGHPRPHLGAQSAWWQARPWAASSAAGYSGALWRGPCSG